MKIIIKEKQLDTENYKIGDLFEIELLYGEGQEIFIYELINVLDKYMLIRFDEITKKYNTYNGLHSSIKELFDNFDEDTKIIAHYPSNDYKLVLTKK